MSEYLDNNNDGIPDAFERRPSITEILSQEDSELVPANILADTVIVEIEARARPPHAGERYILGGFTSGIFLSKHNYDEWADPITAFIIKRVISGKFYPDE